jgi:hypothetical protein
LQAFLLKYRAATADVLQCIYQASNPSSRYNRFLIIRIVGQRYGSVVCEFQDHVSKLRFEASYGFECVETRTFHHPAEWVAALGRLGSTEDPHGNFYVDLDLSDPPDFNPIADLLLRALHDAYGARAQSDLQFSAPFPEGTINACVNVRSSLLPILSDYTA